MEQFQSFDPAVISTTWLLHRLVVSPTITTLSRGNALPETRIGAGDRTPPTDVIFPSGVFFYESLEGMRVTAQDAVAVSPTNIRANSSELWAVLDQGAGATGINSRGGITISPNDFNPERIQIDDRLFTNFSNPPVNVGDLLGDVTGVIGYGFGNYQFLVTEPISVLLADCNQRSRI